MENRQTLKGNENLLKYENELLERYIQSIGVTLTQGFKNSTDTITFLTL